MEHQNCADQAKHSVSGDLGDCVNFPVEIKILEMTNAVHWSNPILRFSNPPAGFLTSLEFAL